MCLHAYSFQRDLGADMVKMLWELSLRLMDDYARSGSGTGALYIPQR